MKEKTKLRVIQILCIVSLLITVFSVERTYAKYYEKIGNSKIKSHKIHENGLRETVFENGVSVFVNYSETELSCEAGTVSAESFLVWEANV